MDRTLLACYLGHTTTPCSGVEKGIWNLNPMFDDSNEPMPYRAAFLGILGSLVALGIFSSIAGMALWVAGVFFGVYFLLSFCDYPGPGGTRYTP